MRLLASQLRCSFFSRKKPRETLDCCKFFIFVLFGCLFFLRLGTMLGVCIRESQRRRLESECFRFFISCGIFACSGKGRERELFFVVLWKYLLSESDSIGVVS